MTHDIQAFFHTATFTVTYVVTDPDGMHCAIVDPVLDYDPKTGRTSTVAADEVIDFAQSNNLIVDWILETHAHADHLSAAPYLKQILGGSIGIGEHITDVQSTFGKVFNVADSFACDGSQFDHLFVDGETFKIGELTARVLHTPGHTPACVTYVLNNVAFVGDTLFMPDYGTARTDFPGGDAATLFASIERILSLPETTRLFMCHDYMAEGRDHFAWESTVAAERDENIHIGAGVSEQDFVVLRNARDMTLESPTLLLPAVQVNMRAGNMPEPEDNGISYLKIPVNRL